LDNGQWLSADLVLVGIGVSPRTELAHDVGLDGTGAIRVDEHAQASDPRVVAAGDVTLLPHPSIPDELVRLESVQNAVEQAKIAAATICGRKETYSAVPWFWSNQADLKLQIAGLSTGFDNVIVRGDPDEESFTALYYRGGRLIAGDSVNRPADFVAIRHALASKATIQPSSAADVTLPLKALIQVD
jgi:3-phenylpropionate/trans-cinnamate dioxygenase ferredoxin reductase subunit